jgi:hypothetical protein
VRDRSAFADELVLSEERHAKRRTQTQRADHERGRGLVIDLRAAATCRSCQRIVQVDETLSVPLNCVGLPAMVTVPEMFAWKLPVIVLPLTVYVPDVYAVVMPLLVQVCPLLMVAVPPVTANVRVQTAPASSAPEARIAPLAVSVKVIVVDTVPD